MTRFDRVIGINAILRAMTRSSRVMTCRLEESFTRAVGTNSSDSQAAGSIANRQTPNGGFHKSRRGLRCRANVMTLPPARAGTYRANTVTAI
jgi:hypothetical protein